MVEGLGEPHIRYAYAAYKTGAMEVMGLETGLSPGQFSEAFADHALRNYHFGWVMSAPTARGEIPVGMVFGQVAGPSIMVGDWVWFPWASVRNTIESAAAFFAALRDDVVLVMYLTEAESRVADYYKQLGLIRPVGRIHDVFEGPAMMYQTRRAVR